MSGAGENRWRRPGQGNNQNRNSGANTPTKEAGRQQAPSTTTGNAWGGKGKTAGPAPAPAAQTNAPAVHHVPVRDFNSNEVRDFLKKKYIENTAGTVHQTRKKDTETNNVLADKPSVHHKVQGDSVAKRASGAWGSRGNMSHLMPGGQDFFALLRKQLSAVDQSKPVQ
ncbi:hypothetical protein HBI56_009550 [Parastagonospora nodorum]|nr:hypothetical protein HBH53_078250 [Parastagonospora nodorum]KAH3986908.1 hypothetical protein HBH51_011300 [Parastagonospora nodorum]KAH4033388.1 hypothetical protein HBI13_009970 [Parastagonospora nodorum]KAH4042196.1 hypothetical protein HBI09_009910 [Parastagonospora nodorum]KAH4110962.1 hypothetical protein HBH46_009590 [Parastagonospora nodorum]